MKRISVLVLSVFAAVSCLEPGSFSQAYIADVTFEFADPVYTESFKDSIYVMTEGEAFNDNRNPLLFAQKYENGVFKGGILLSYLKGEKDGALTKEPVAKDAYRVNAESGHNGSKTYAVFYDNPDQTQMPKHDVEFFYRNSGTLTPNGCFVNNTTLVARKIKEHFTDGDKLVLKAIGVKKDGSTVETSIKLAEFTESKDSVMYNWTAFPLSALGTVDYIDFHVESTNPAVPGYFCLDGLNCGVAINF